MHRDLYKSLHVLYDALRSNGGVVGLLMFAGMPLEGCELPAHVSGREHCAGQFFMA